MFLALLSVPAFTTASTSTSTITLPLSCRYDYMVWYPLGRPIGTTIYPGMQFASVWIWQGLNGAGYVLTFDMISCLYTRFVCRQHPSTLLGRKLGS